MNFLKSPFKKDFFLVSTIIILIVFGLYILNSLSPEIFPQYYIYVFVAFIAFYVFYGIGFEVLKYFSIHLYIVSIILLILTLIIGRITRGAIRWIPIGGISLQPSEIVRPFLMLYFANLISKYSGKYKNLLLYIPILLIPVVLIAIQPSLGVSIVTFIGLFVILLVKLFSGKKIVIMLLSMLVVIPSVWFILKPYQKERIISFVNYQQDVQGSGYNTIQSIISIGSGGLLGRGFRKGFQTQLKYLPEKHTDFVFASVSEEMGFVGSIIILILLFTIYLRVISYLDSSQDEVYRLFVLGTITVFLVETLINIGMNLGLLPITGLPLPFVSAGGSSLLSSMIFVSILLSGKNGKKPL